MIRGLATGLCLFIAGLLCLPASAWWQSVLQVSTGPAVFQGPGDIITTNVVEYWGLQAYTAAYATGLNKAVRVCDAGDAHCGDLSFGTDGAVVDSTIAGASGPCSSITCTIITFYSQNGGDDITQNTEAGRATIVFNCQGGHACARFATGRSYAKPSWHGGVAVAQPWTISAAYKDTGSSTVTAGTILTADDTVVAEGLYSNDGSANIAECYAGSVLSATAANNAWHAVSAVGTTSPNADINVDGSANNGNCGTRSLAGSTIRIGNDLGTAFFVGDLGYVMVRSSGNSGGDSSSLSSITRTFWGF